MKFNLQTVGTLVIILIILFLLYHSTIPNNTVSIFVQPKRRWNLPINTWKPRRPIPVQHLLGPGGQQWIF